MFDCFMNKEKKFSNNEKYSHSETYNVAIIANFGTIFGLYNEYPVSRITPRIVTQLRKCILSTL